MLRCGMLVRIGELHFQKFIEDAGLSGNQVTYNDYVGFRHRYKYKGLNLKGEVVREAVLNHKFKGKWYLINVYVTPCTTTHLTFHESELEVVHPYILQDKVTTTDGKNGTIIYIYDIDDIYYATVKHDSGIPEDMKVYNVADLSPAHMVINSTLTEWLDSLHLLS